MTEKSTYLLFGENKAIISPDIVPVFTFLIEIEKEIESILGFQKKLDEIRSQYLEVINLIQFLSKKLKENDIDFEYTLKERPELIAEKLIFHLPLRSQMIVLYASLEVLYFLHIAYEKEIDDDDKMKEVAMKDKDFLKKFINHFLLSEENDYYKNNKSRLSKIDSKKIRELRNSLTHFFSLSSDGLSVIPKILNEKARKLEALLKKNKHGNVVFISPEDLHELIKYANHLKMKKWSDDFQNNPTDFGRKMLFVVNVVKKYGAMIVYDKDLNI